MLTASSVSVLASSSLSEATPSSVSTASLLSKAAAESSASSTGKSNQFQVLTLVSMGSKGNRSQIGQPATRNRTSSVHESIDGGLSTKVSNPRFYVTPSHPANLSQSQTWKSDEAKQRDQFDRTKILLQHFAPEQFKPRAKPANEPASIVPQTYLQYQIHKKELEAEEMLNKIAFLEAKKARSNLEPIRQAFNGKFFKSGRSSVLSQLTIWSDNFEPTYEHPQIAWPDRDQLHEDGEKRENKFAPTRCGRFLPALRYPDTGVFMPQYPLDQVGPLRSQGPTPAVCKQENEAMDFDNAFEAKGMECLGQELMGELGRRQPPFVPEWLARQRYEKELVSGQYYRYFGGISTY
jgi:hypothetical protein